MTNPARVSPDFSFSASAPFFIARARVSPRLQFFRLCAIHHCASPSNVHASHDKPSPCQPPTSVGGGRAPSALPQSRARKRAPFRAASSARSLPLRCRPIVFPPPQSPLCRPSQCTRLARNTQPRVSPDFSFSVSAPFTIARAHPTYTPRMTNPARVSPRLQSGEAGRLLPCRKVARASAHPFAPPYPRDLFLCSVVLSSSLRHNLHCATPDSTLPHTKYPARVSPRLQSGEAGRLLPCRKVARASAHPFAPPYPRDLFLCSVSLPSSSAATPATAS
jgi:hypothetical protein